MRNVMPDRSKGTMYHLETMTIGVFEQFHLFVVYSNTTPYANQLTLMQVIILKELLQHHPKPVLLQHIVEALGHTYTGPEQACVLKQHISRLRHRLRPDLIINSLISHHVTDGYMLIETAAQRTST